ncbi:hypothetical protein EAG_09115 [Camponotus floridanus]|uniref:Uncharacterized protein n=1 Tax=Camponotus floridanus TaxID=104421 RepID=E2AHC4_CAMFO|nr:hypothetical protein EAG_09115 [Camponotus floridanus]
MTYGVARKSCRRVKSLRACSLTEGTSQTKSVFPVNVLIEFISSYYLLHLSQLRARNPFACMLVAISRSHAVQHDSSPLTQAENRRGEVITAGWLAGWLAGWISVSLSVYCGRSKTCKSHPRVMVSCHDQRASRSRRSMKRLLYPSDDATLSLRHGVDVISGIEEERTTERM